MNLTLAFYRASNARMLVSVSTIPGRRRFQNPLRPRTGETADHAAVTRFISIAEEFTLGRFVDATEPIVPRTPTFVPTLWEHELAIVSSNWERRIAGWKQLHSVNIKSFPYWAEFDGFICARNVIATASAL